MSVEFERRVHATLPEPRIEHFDFTLVSTTRTGPKLVVQNGRSKVIQLNIQAFIALESPEYVQVGVDIAHRVMLVKACKQDDDNAFRLKKSRRLTFGYKTQALFDSGMHSVPGEMKNGAIYFRW